MLTTAQIYAALILLGWAIAWPATAYWLGSRRGHYKGRLAGYAQGTADARQQMNSQQDARWRSQRNEIEQLHTQLKQAQRKLATLSRPFDTRDADTLRHVSRELITLAGTYDGFQSHQRAAETRTLANICNHMATRMAPAADQTTPLEAAA